MVISANSREEADKAYLQTFGFFDVMATEEWNTPEHREEFIKEEFIAEVTIESYRPYKEGEDLEFGDPADERNELARAFEDGLAWAKEEVVETTANPFMEILWWNETDKILRLCAAGTNPRHPEKREFAANATYQTWPKPEMDTKWVRSSFGEDAYGVVFCTAEELMKR